MKNAAPPSRRRASSIFHDTLELFGGALDDLRALWIEQIQPSMPNKTAKRAETLAHGTFGRVTDTIREAVRIPQGRSLTPDALRAACEYGLDEILGG